MPKLRNVQNRIRATEGFRVKFRYWGGKDVRDDLTGMPLYPRYEKMALNDMTVAYWKTKRFYPAYPGYDVDVLDADGNPCAGNTKLRTVRGTYRNV